MPTKYIFCRPTGPKAAANGLQLLRQSVLKQIDEDGHLHGLAIIEIKGAVQAAWRGMGPSRRRR